MKRFAKLLVATSAITLLAGCSRGKAAWTDEEKKVFEDYLFFELPIFEKANMTVSFNKEKGFVVATGNVSTADDVKAYVDLLTNKENGYVEDASVSTDLAAFFELDEVHQLRKSTGYVVHDVVAVGLDADKKLTAVATVCYSYWESVFFDDGMYFSAEGIEQAQFNAALDQGFEYANTFEDESGEEYETFVAGDFVYPEIASADFEGWGVTDYQYAFPWSYGNVYSEYFFSWVEVTYIGADEDDDIDYAVALEDAGFELVAEPDEDSDYYSYEKETTGGIAYIDTVYDDEFFTDGTSALSVSFAFEPVLE